MSVDPRSHSFAPGVHEALWGDPQPSNGVPFTPFGLPIVFPPPAQPSIRSPPSQSISSFPSLLHPLWNHEAAFDVAQIASDISISLWDRSPLHPSSFTTNGLSPSATHAREEIFVGSATFSPPVEPGKTEDRWVEVYDRESKPRGEVRVQATFTGAAPHALGPTDFDLLKVIGKGSFGKVLQVRKTDTGRVYAMKILPKRDIVDRKEVAHTLSERNVLIMASSPFLVGLKFSFQTPEKLYLVLDYMAGGELFYHLQREVVFREERARFYAAELVLAIEHLHNHDVVYRDLKPENILLDSTGHIALTDFGLCKENVGYDAATNTFCGTAEYLAPEILTGQGYGKAVDWWSLGILFYEMTTGLPPFYSENTNVMYNKILHTQVAFPPGYSREAESLVRGLLERDPKRRLGSPPLGALAIKRHPFFRSIDWDRLLQKKVQPPHKPQVASETDTSNFDTEFTNALPVDSLPSGSQPPLSQTVQDHFKGFSYQGENPFFGRV
ncbi:Pkinase-domain-containing protein [Gonapodya prolifera JEL478]|uniref:non-specific serine/threonine protein kinase n=1 Tax=Gonapodya prolifera (strain JEL478) TaxID=1344416 RepID=A0A138ZXI4_GONPJ|nr:Pkinase-domain-containing protein [Gonapodya prolifera JEL478]|eukprot:KXS09199.1 Pkinase-domain-containing protein [Gonapodya prolifera JEL478]